MEGEAKNNWVARPRSINNKMFKDSNAEFVCLQSGQHLPGSQKMPDEDLSNGKLFMIETKHDVQPT